jgi:predicted small metal-binding protein
MFEYVCEHVIPGCTTKVEAADTPEAAREKALEHLHQHHGMEYIDGPTSEKISLAIVPVQR